MAKRATHRKAAVTAIGLGGVAFKNMAEMVEFSRLMAGSGAAVPMHLRDNPGACLAICIKAARFGFDPFTLAEHSFLASKGYGAERTDAIAYDSFVIRAIIVAHAPITGVLQYSYDGEGGARTCTVTAITKDGGKANSLTSPTLDELKAQRTENGEMRGSALWDNKPDQQLGYDTGRDYCRLYHPDILMGWYDKDELQQAVAPKPKPRVGERLNGGAGAGFSQAGIDAALAVAPAPAAAVPDEPELPLNLPAAAMTVIAPDNHAHLEF
jgi:hypothetical protein